MSLLECATLSLRDSIKKKEKEYLCNLYCIFSSSSCSIVIYARGMYADDSMYKALDKSNTRIQVNMK